MEKPIKPTSHPAAAITGIILFAFIYLLISGPRNNVQSPTTPTNSVVSVSTSSQQKDPSIIIPTVFLGEYSWNEIKPKLDLILIAASEPITEEKYLNVANALFELRKSSSRLEMTEMMILDRALLYYSAIESTESNLKLANALALAVTELDIEAE